MARGEEDEAGLPEASGMLSQGYSELPMPRYAMGTTSHTLPQYTNAEGEAINRAFTTGNYDMIHLLPEKLEHLAVIRKKQELQQQVRNMAIMAGKDGLLPSQAGATNIHGLFKDFEYMPTDYMREEAERRGGSRKPDPETVERVAEGRPFIPNGMAGRGSGHRMKYEDMFAEKDYRYPYLGGDFTQDDEDLLSESWINKSYEIDSRFQPAGTAGLRGPMGYGDRPTRKGMPELLAVLKRVLATDWEGSAFDILLDTTGCVVVRFELATVESRDGLAAYMNVLLKSNPLVIPFLMSRVPEYWNKERMSGQVDFTMRPPWVPNRAMGKVFSQMHPEYLETGAVSVAENDKEREPEQGG